MSIDRLMDKDVGGVYTHTVEYYSAIKNNEISWYLKHGWI